MGHSVDMCKPLNGRIHKVKSVVLILFSFLLLIVQQLYIVYQCYVHITIKFFYEKECNYSALKLWEHFHTKSTGMFFKNAQPLSKTSKIIG